jgi:molybdenum cofactor cytidylyltransferase
MEPVGILLAAGRSVRFGANKLLHHLPDGSPLGAVSARVLCGVLTQVVAVVRVGDDALAETLHSAGADIVVCPHADAGMGASLACGIGATRQAAGWVVGLADMPCLRPATIHAVVEALKAGAALAAPVLPDGHRGHPVGFAAEWGDALCALRGDQGARALLHRHADRLTPILTEDIGCLLDVDIPSDIINLLSPTSK